MRQIHEWLVSTAGIDPRDYSRIAIVAQGGYGRAQLNPHSDIDLLFLLPEPATPAEQAFVKSFLYFLWDLGNLDVGHATKRLSDVLSVVGNDLTNATRALIETRLVAGDGQPVDLMTAKLARMLRGSAKKWFVQSKLAAMASRREKYGSSVYLLEPNVKDGEGGLRDIHSLQWLAYVLLGSGDLETLVQSGILTEGQLDEMRNAFDHILSVRTMLHSVEGRKSDVLTFEKQPDVARKLGYASDTHLAEEKLLRDYYFHARVIDRFGRKATRGMTAKARTIRGEMLDKFRRRSIGKRHYSKNGELFLKKMACPVSHGSTLAHPRVLCLAPTE